MANKTITIKPSEKTIKVLKHMKELKDLQKEITILKFKNKELKKQLNLCGVRFELPNDEIFKQDIVNLKNPLEEFYYYEAPSHSKWELAEFRQSLKKALDFLKGN